MMIRNDLIQARYERDPLRTDHVGRRLTLDEVRRYAQLAATEARETRVVICNQEGIYSHDTLAGWEGNREAYGPGCFVVGTPVEP